MQRINSCEALRLPSMRSIQGCSLPAGKLIIPASASANALSRLDWSSVLIAINTELLLNSTNFTSLDGDRPVVVRFSVVVELHLEWHHRVAANFQLDFQTCNAMPAGTSHLT